MIKNLKKTFFAVSSVVLTMPIVVGAVTIKKPPGDFGAEDLAYGGGGSNESIAEVLGQIITWILGFVGALAILMIIVAGIMYLTSGGDEGRVENAKRWLIYAIVGLIVALLGWVIVNTVITKLG